MNILPFETFDIRSSLSKENVVSNLKQATAKQQFIGTDTSKLLVGSVHEDEFLLMRRIYYGNAFLPKAVISIEDSQKGCILKVRLRMNSLVSLFMGIWLLFALFGVINWIGFSSKSITDIEPLMLIFGYGLMSFGFWTEVPKLKSILYQLTTENLNY